ncbi:MAG: hypothetical protein IPK19_35935 [Chloroflexi bacterium]|nr:hypothetical protein [Chloroflexota bacterium]
MHNPYDRLVPGDRGVLVAPPGWLGMGGTAIIPLEARGKGQVSLPCGRRPTICARPRRARVRWI